MTPEEEIAPALIEAAVAVARGELIRARNRLRLLTLKVKEVGEDLDAIEKYLEEQKTLPPTTELERAIRDFATRLRPFQAELRDLARRVEAVSDRLEELIP